MSIIIEPEVPAQLGENTEQDTSVHPPIIKKLHLDFYDWLGDDLLTCFPRFFVTKQLKEKIEAAELSRIIFENLKVTKSEFFMDIHPEKHLPTFYWAKIIGTSLQSDFSLGTDHRLIVSEKAFVLLNQFKIENARIEELPL